MLVNLLDERSLTFNREAFMAIDRDLSGAISKERLQEYMESNLPQMTRQSSSEAAERIISTVDTDGNGVVNYKEFLSATLDSQGHLSPVNITQLFSYLDPHKSGVVTAASLQRTFAKHGKAFSEGEVRMMLRDVGLDPEKPFNIADL